MVKTAFYIARRYLISKKSVNVINLISGISVAGVTISTLALVVILSAFNGIDHSIRSMFSTFDPDIRITAAKGKSFDPSQTDLDALSRVSGVLSVIPVVEDDVLLRYGDRQYFATIKGVPVNYSKISDFDTTSITSGRFLLEANQIPFALVGQGVAYFLSVGLNFTEPVHIYTLKRGTTGRPSVANALNHTTIYASGVFSNQQEIDSKYVLVPFVFAQELFQLENQVNAIELELKDCFPDEEVKTEVQRILGSDFLVKTQFEQHELFYRVMQSEKWAIFLILGFILIIASFNILGSLSMLIIDKKADISILQSMGANQQMIRTIFLLEGWMISLAGAVLGLILGVAICWIQMEFGLLKIPGTDGAFIFSSYPVKIRVGDLLAVFALVSGIGFLAAWYPIRFISGKFLAGLTD